MSVLGDITAAAVDEALRGKSFEIDAVVDAIVASAPDVFVEESERLARAGLRKAIKDIMRARTDTMTAQQALPGFRFPRAIAIEREGGEVLYVPTERATWADVCAGAATRQMHIYAAEKKHTDYIEAMDRLRAWMAEMTPPDGKRTARTVGEAMRRMAIG